MMSGKWRTNLFRLGLLIGALLLLYQVYNGIKGLFDKAITFQQPIVTILSLILVFIALGLQVLAWKLMMKSISINLPLKEIYANYFLTFLPRFIPGSVWGYLSRAEWLHREKKVPYALTNIGSLIEIGIGLLSVLQMSLFYLSQRTILPYQILTVILGAVLPVFVWVILRYVTRLRILKQPLLVKWGVPCLNTLEFFAFVSACFLITFNWFIYGLSLALLIKSLGLPIDLLAPGLPLTLSNQYAFAWFVGFIIIFIPSGIGIRELTLGLILISLFHYATDQASGIAVLFRFISLLAELIWLGLGMMLSFGSKNRKQIPASGA